MAAIYSYDDIDTAFPRHGSLRGVATFDDEGRTLHFATNARREDFVKQFMGALVRQDYYPRGISVVAKVIEISFDK